MLSESTLTDQLQAHLATLRCLRQYMRRNQEKGALSRMGVNLRGFHVLLKAMIFGRHSKKSTVDDILNEIQLTSMLRIYLIRIRQRVQRIRRCRDSGIQRQI